jgi:hypothetical protein
MSTGGCEKVDLFLPHLGDLAIGEQNCATCHALSLIQHGYLFTKRTSAPHSSQSELCAAWAGLASHPARAASGQEMQLQRELLKNPINHMIPFYSPKLALCTS